MMKPKSSSASRLSLLVLLTVGFACFGCKDLATITFQLPTETYGFDASQFNLPPGTLPSVPCTDSGSCCTVATAAGIDCASVVCDAPSGTCAVTVTVESPPQVIDLKAQVSQLGGLQSQSFADVTVSQIIYTVDPNTLNVALPPVDLFLANNGATSTADPSAQKFGTVPATPAMTTVVGQQVTLDGAGQQAFVNYAKNFGTPFEVIARTTIVVPGGTPLPTGALTISVTGRVSITPSL
jgi:hypothetical protein